MHCSSHDGPSQSQFRLFSSVFVSKHNHSLNVTSNDILEYCNAHGIATHDARTTNSHVILKECPFCEKPTRNKADNFYKLYLQIGGGAYFCHRCGAGGSWFDWKIQFGSHSMPNGQRAGTVGVQKVTTGSSGSSNSSSSTSSVTSSLQTANSSSRTVPPLPMPPRRLQALYINDLFASSSDGKKEPNQVLDYLTSTRGLTEATLRKYGVGSGKYSFPGDDGTYKKVDCVTFSWIMSLHQAELQEVLRGSQLSPSLLDEYIPKAKDNEKQQDMDSLKDQIYLTRRIKARALSNKAWQRLDPPGGAWGFFGYHTIPKDAKEIVLCEGEYDAMAVWQATGRPAISLPNGCRSLPVETLPLLEDFERIYLWMDNDGPGQEGAELFSKKLGLERCHIVRPTKHNIGLSLDGPEDVKLPKDANDALRMGCNLQSILDDAKLTPHEQILTFEELRSDVLHEILHPDMYVGTPMPSLPKVTGMIKGLRRGELTVLTGPTGSGKTTFLGQMSLDLAEQDINVLWGSFEIKNTRLIHKLLQQYMREPLPSGEQASSSTKLESIADRFSQLPLYFLKFHGGSDVDDVLDAMDYAVYVNDCQHIILDNMQFMISRKLINSSWDKFDVQDAAIEKFRKFATDRNVHVTLVCHPRKEAEDTRLNISSFYGSAKATQEADTVLILQNERGKKSLEVKKNRFNGNLGHIPLYFERQSGRYTEEQPYQSTPSSSSHSSSNNHASSSSTTTMKHNPYPTGSKKILPKFQVPNNAVSDRVETY